MTEAAHTGAGLDRSYDRFAAFVLLADRHKWWLGALFVLIVGAMVVVPSFIAPVYRASTTLAPAEDEADGGQLSMLGAQLGPLVGLGGGALGGNNVAELLSTLESRVYTTSFIERHELMPQLFADRWDASKSEWREDGEAPPEIEDGFTLMSEIRRVAQDARSGLITISVDWTDREAAADWVNLLVNDFNRHARENAIEDAETSLAFLEKELETTTLAPIQSGIYRLMETQINRRMLASVKSQYAFRVIDPAVAPSADRRHYPRRSVFGLFGIALGVAVVLGIIVLLMLRQIVLRARASVATSVSTK
ncbi:MAG: hypothetical protein AB8G16_08760 [Gammaproteobacteria bacterium]